jgi:hypothetical protein
VGIGVVFRSIVVVLRVGFFGCKSLQPRFKIGMETGLIVIDKDGSSDVHCVNQT